MILDDLIGNTPLVSLKRMPAAAGGTVMVKLEGQNPAGSVKDRPAFSMISEAERRGEIRPGDTLIEATSGNTGIALAMVAAMRGYRMKLIMPDNMSAERRTTMSVYGAELVLVTKEQGMEHARDLAVEMERRGEGRVLDQFANPDNPLAHYRGTGPEIWRQTEGRITHFVSAMGTTGTIMGVSRFLKEQNPDIVIVGVQPDDESSIPGIRMSVIMASKSSFASISSASTEFLANSASHSRSAASSILSRPRSTWGSSSTNRTFMLAPRNHFEPEWLPPPQQESPLVVR